MKPEHKRYILENIRKKSIKEISEELNLKEKKIRKFLDEDKQIDSEKRQKTFPRHKNILLPVTLIIILGFIVYGNSLDGKFVLDDTYLVKNNTYIKSWSNLQKVFAEDIAGGTPFKTNFYRPLHLITLMSDYSLWGFEAKGYHLTNILLHISVVLCIYWLINIIYKDNILSSFTAVLFLVHPVHTEAITYISGRADPLAALFIILCFIFYIKSCDRERPAAYILMLLSYILALLSRESSLILPLLLILYHYTHPAPRRRLKIKQFASLLGLAFIYILIRFTALKSLQSNMLYTTTLLQRIPGFFAAIINYIKLMILPLGLHMEYGNKLFSPADPRVILGIFTTLLLLFLALRKRAANNLIFFSIAWFFIALLPQSNIYPINAYMAEHWLYLPSVGFFLILAKGLSYLYKRRESQTVAISILVLLSAFYSYLTIRQNYYWKEPLTFYERTLRYAPNSAKMLNNLAHIYCDIGKRKEAMSMFEKSIESNPNFAEAYNNLGILYFNDVGDVEKAIALFKKAVEINPNFAGAYNNLGIIYKNIGKKEEAIASHKKAIEIRPDYALAHGDLALLYFDNKEYDLAIEHCNRAIELGYEPDPRLLEALKPYRK